MTEDLKVKMTEDERKAALKEANACLKRAIALFDEAAIGYPVGYASTGSAATWTRRKLVAAQRDVILWHNRGDHTYAMHTSAAI